MKKVSRNQNDHISSFILKLTSLLQDAGTKDIIVWSPEGDSLVIDNHKEQLESILSKYFNHRKISSFIRQLNLYGFRKVSQKYSMMIYKHQYFIRDKINLYKMIKRRRKLRSKSQKMNKVQNNFQNQLLQRQRSKIKGLQEVYYHIKQKNQIITKETSLIKESSYNLTQIKQNPLFNTLKRIYSESQKNKELNRLLPNLFKPNDQLISPETEAGQIEQSLGSKNRRTDDVNQEKGFNGLDSDQNIDLDMLNQNMQDLPCGKNNQRDERYGNFWQDQQLQMDCTEYV